MQPWQQASCLMKSPKCNDKTLEGEEEAQKEKIMKMHWQKKLEEEEEEEEAQEEKTHQNALTKNIGRRRRRSTRGQNPPFKSKFWYGGGHLSKFNNLGVV